MAGGGAGGGPVDMTGCGSPRGGRARPARALIGSPGFGNIGAVAFNRAKFGGGIAVTARDDGDSDGTSAVLFTTDPLRPVRVHGNVASIAGGGAYLSENNDIESTEETALCAYEFRIDDNRAPEGAAFFLDTDNALTVRAGAAARLNVSDTFRCGGVGDPPDPAARACAMGVVCNSIDGNVVQQANGQPATGAVVRLKENATIEGRRIAFTGNSGNDLMLVSANAEGPVPFHVDIRDCLVAGNQLTARLIAADTALIDSCTMAGNSLALSTLSITARAEIRNSIVWQPGFATLAPAPAVLAGSMLLSNDLVGLPGATDAPPRFIDPPQAWWSGVLVGRDGARICNETLYGGKVGEHLVERHGGHGTVIMDARIMAQGRSQVRNETLQLYQRAFGVINGYLACRSAPTLRGLAGILGIDADNLEATIRTYNDGVRAGHDALGKAIGYLAPIEQGPFFGIPIDSDSWLYPAPCLTLGGLRTDAMTAQVTTRDGATIDGLYAAGRTAVGVASNGYVSGLSVADGIFSGRAAGRHAAARARPSA